MASIKHKTFARVSDYGDLLVPLALMEKIIDQGYLVSTTYENGHDVINEVKEIKRIHVHKGEEIEAALAQQALRGE